MNIEVNWFLIVAATLFMVMDIATGVVGAFVNKNVDSQIMKMGLLHKCGFILAIMFGYLCEFAMVNSGTGWYIPIGTGVTVYIILTEIASNLENFAKISPEFANKKFMALFKGVQEKFGKDLDEMGISD